jgi:multidrug efflux pump subunit AcrA (membrane-fusion protein)
MIVNAFVNQADVEAIRIGARARVRSTPTRPGVAGHVYSVVRWDDRTLPGELPQRDPGNSEADKLDPRVIPDLSVSVDVVVGSESGPALAPREALFEEPGRDSPYVYVKDGSGWQKRDVSVGLTNNTTAVIRSGLRPGEVLAAERRRSGSRRNRARGRNRSMSKDVKPKQRIGQQPGAGRRKVLFWALGVVLASGGAYAYYRYTNTNTVVEVPVARVRRGEFIISVNTRGEIRSVRSIVLTAPQVPNPSIVASGRIGQADPQRGSGGGIRCRPTGTELPGAHHQRPDGRERDRADQGQPSHHERDGRHESDDVGYNLQRAELEASKAEILSEIEGAKNRI